MHVSVNIRADYLVQEQCDNFVQYHRLEAVMNDYNTNPSRGPVQTNAVHDRFSIPYLKPVFLVINCLSNSTQQAEMQLMLTEDAGYGDFSDNGPTVARWRAAIDSVQAPLPLIMNARLDANGAFRFNFPGQRGRTNQVLGTSDLVNWTVLTNVTGTNAPILFREPGALSKPGRIYRVRRL